MHPLVVSGGVFHLADHSLSRRNQKSVHFFAAVFWNSYQNAVLKNNTTLARDIIYYMDNAFD